MQVISRPLEAGIFAATSYFSTLCQLCEAMMRRQTASSLWMWRVSNTRPTGCHSPIWQMLCWRPEIIKTCWTLSCFLSCHTFVSRMLLNVTQCFSMLLTSSHILIVLLCPPPTIVTFCRWIRSLGSREGIYMFTCRCAWAAWARSSPCQHMPSKLRFHVDFMGAVDYSIYIYYIYIMHIIIIYVG